MAQDGNASKFLDDRLGPFVECHERLTRRARNQRLQNGIEAQQPVQVRILLPYSLPQSLEPTVAEPAFREELSILLELHCSQCSAIRRRTISKMRHHCRRPHHLETSFP